MKRITPEKLRKIYYQPHVSARDVAQYFECSPTTIKNYLDKYGFRVKRRHEVMYKRKISKEHRDKIIQNLKQFTS